MVHGVPEDPEALGLGHWLALAQALMARRIHRLKKLSAGQRFYAVDQQVD